jgi:hypothetical protein
MDTLPTLDEFMNFGPNHVDISERIGDKYYKFGVSLLEDTDGSKMGTLEVQLKHNAEFINIKVLKRWIRGEGREPRSWATLAAVLDECNLTALSEEIRSVKSRGVYTMKTECHTPSKPSKAPDNSGKPIELAENRGLAVLVTCDYVNSPLKEEHLPGTEMDFTKMKAAFDQFGYNVHTLQNSEATVNAVDDLMNRISSELKHHGQDSCTCNEKVIVFAFSGHGDKDEILLHDGQVSLFGDILQYFRADNDYVFDIPKLFFINACRGKNELKKSMARKDVMEEEGNYRFDYATIPDCVSYEETKWMVKLAEMLVHPVEGNDSLQNISAKVKKQVVNSGTEKVQLQQCESLDRLSTGPLNLYFKRK